MFKRLVIAVAFAAMTLLIGTGSDAVFANEGNKNWLTDGTIQGNAWQGLPDNLNRSAKFVVLDGFRNNGLGAVGDAGQRTTLTLTFDRAPEDNCVRIALFDPNSIGRWDQFVDGQLVRKAPDVLYEVFKPITLVDGKPVCTEDLLLDGNTSNDPAPMQVTSAYKNYNTSPLNNNDDIWVDLVDLTAAQADAAGLKLTDGRFRLVFRATLLPAPVGIAFGQDHDPLTVARDVSSFTGRERSAYKIAFDGTYLIPAGGTLGFAGGIIDERVSCSGPNGEGCGSTRDDMDGTTGASDPVTMVDKTATFATKQAVSTKYWYDGVFNFHLHSSHACEGDVDFKDADADWVDVANLTANDFDANGFLTGAALTGIPPENVGRYIRPNNNTCGGKRDIGQTKIPGGALLGTCADRDRLIEFDGSADQSLNADGVVNWNIFPIGGYVGHNTAPVNPADPVTYSSRDSAFCGRASYTVGVEVANANAADCPSGGAPFKTNTLDQATLQADPGLWCLQWRGLDCANFVFMQFNVPVGTTPRPKLKIDVFCDIDKDCERTQNDEPLPINGGVAKLTLTEVDCDTEQPIVGGVDITIETDATGVWTSPSCPALPAGCYKIDWDGPAPLPGGLDCRQLPTLVDLSADASDNQCVEVQIPLDCTGTISGDVFCKDPESTAGCSYTPPGDQPLPAGTRIRVIATRTTPNGPESVEVEVVAPATSYMIEGLEFDTYTVSYAFITNPDGITPAPSCPLTRQAVLTSAQTSVTDVDFGFDCVPPGEICGDVYCEAGTDCSYNPTTDGPLPNGTKYIVELYSIENAVRTKVGEVKGTAPVTEYCFRELDLGDYEVQVINDPTSTPAQMLPIRSASCQEIKEVSLTLQTPEVADCDFGYICTVDICGNVYCEETDDCKYNAISADGPLPTGSVVIVTLTPIVGGQSDIANQQTRTVTPPETEYCFRGLDFGTYEISWAFQAGSTVFELFGACEEVKTETVDASTGSIDDCDFGFVCDADITGRVFCDKNLNGSYESPPDSPPISATIEAQLIPAAGPLPAPLTTMMGINGTFAFNDIAPGKYVLNVIAIDPSTWDPLFDDANGIEVDVPAGEERNVLFPYNCCLGEIHGTVYCDDDLSGSLTLGDLRFAGVEVTATSPGNPDRTDVTNAQGEYAFVDLEPGTWTVAVSTAQLPWSGPGPVPTAPQPPSYVIDVARGDMIMDKDFVSLCLGRIYGYVFQDPLGDCDGIYQEAGDDEVDGARIRLTGPAILPGPNPRETVTNAAGYYEFSGLPRGTYKVEILDPLTDKWVVLGLALNAAVTPREVPGIVLPRLGEERVDFGFCIQKLEGYVFQDDPDQDCDGVYQPNSDIPVDGATIRLTGPAGLPAPNPRTTTSDANGYYEFPDLVPGDYTVEILSPLPAKWEAINLTLVAGVTAKAQNADLDLGETERIDFGHCIQSLGGRVFKQPYGNWDDIWNPAIDTGLGDILIRLRGTSGDALGYDATTRTKFEAFPGDPDAGTYAFENIPTGEYEVTIVNGDAVTNQTLSVLIGDRDRTYTPDVMVGDRITDLDFPFCECEQKLCVNVFREEVDGCNNEYDENVDELLEFIEVRFEQLSTGRNTTLRTDADGRVCLPILEPGDYKVSVAPRQSGLEDCRPSLGAKHERVVSFDPAECEDQELWFGFCCCTKQGCCEGKLSEVVMETRFWMCDPRYVARARLFMDCGGDDLVDVAEAALVDGDFGSVPGAAGVISIESIKRRGPLVTVRVRIKATGTRFPGHSFGNAKHLVTVTLNGETNKICEVFRAEVMRPGAIPGCRVWDAEQCRWVRVEWPCEPGVSYREVEWDRYECGNLCWKFGIVEICCFRDWCRCNCDCPTECEPCRGRVTALALRYDGDHEINGVVIQTDDGRLLFDDAIKPGDVISLRGKGDDRTMGSEIKLFTNDVCLPIKTDCHELLKIGTRLGGFTIIGGASSEGGPFCDPTRDANGRPIDPECRECCIPEKPCDCIAGVTHLAFKYVGRTPKWAVVLQDFDGRYLFEGMVRPGDIIRVRARGDDGTMGSTIKLLTNEFCGELDVTCKKPIGIGTKSGPFIVVGGASRDGGRFCGSIECKDCPPRDEKEEQPCPTCPK